MLTNRISVSSLEYCTTDELSESNNLWIIGRVWLFGDGLQDPHNDFTYVVGCHSVPDMHTLTMLISVLIFVDVGCFSFQFLCLDLTGSDLCSRSR